MIMKNYKLIIGFILGVIISTTGVYAATTIIKSKDVSYDKTYSDGKYDNVQDSIDELYEKAKDAYKIHDTIWKDPVLNGADPILEVEGSTKKLIPITLDSDGTVHYANLYSEWYDYSDKRWANAVILVDNPKNGGTEKYTYKTGDIILEEDIESYFVWIPRYSYKIWNMANTEEYSHAPNITTLADNNYETSSVQAFNKSRIIDIKFGDISTNPRMSESEAEVDKYYTHPAFTLGSIDLNGIWVGKFEVGYNQTSDNGNPISDTSSWTTNGANQNNVASNRVIIKPNVYSWRNSTIQNMFLTSYNYDRKLESHMMKNTEWGAVAYLSHSAYGIGTEVRINNNNQYKTGYSAAANTDQSKYLAQAGNTDTITNSYNKGIGHLASTSGNITGVYDLSGGAAEYVAAYTSGQVGSSGFTDDTELKTTYKNYVDIYPTDSGMATYNKRILGDATGEMGPFYGYYDSNEYRYHNSWYSDDAYFFTTSNPWIFRGGSYYYGLRGGQFHFANYSGKEYNWIGFRLILAIK